MNDPQPTSVFQADFEIWENFLLKLRYQKSRLIKTSTYQSILLDNPQQAWLVYAGYVEVFSVALVNGQPDGTRQFLFRAENGELLFGMRLQDHARGLVVMLSPDAQLLRFESSVLQGFASDLTYADTVNHLLENWLAHLNRLVAPKNAPKEYQLLAHEHFYEVTNQKNVILRVNRGVAWVTHQTGESLWLGDSQFGLQESDLPFPITRHAWLELLTSSKFTVMDTTAFLQTDTMQAALARFHQQILQILVVNAEQAAVRAEQRLLSRTQADVTRFNASLEEIASTLDAPVAAIHRASTSDHALLRACQWVGQHMGMDIQAPPASAGALNLHTISLTNRIHVREVALSDDWWRNDHGALLGYLQGDGQPVALLPQSPSRYLLVDPGSGQTQPVTETLARQLLPLGHQLYSSLPDEPIKPFALLRFALCGSGRELNMILGMGLVLGLLNLTIPLGVSLLFNQVIPGGSTTGLIQVAVLLLIATLATFVFQLTQRIAVVRLESRVEMRTTNAIWDRLLNQKAPFFRQFVAGDLGMRALSFSQIRTVLGDLTSNSLLLVVYLLFNVVAMFVISPVLGSLSLMVMAIAFLFVMRIGLTSLKYTRQLNESLGENMGYMLQYINGIQKFRVAGAEMRVFADWAGRFTHQRRITYQMRILQNSMIIFSVAYPIFAITALFAVVGFYREEITVAALAAFFVVFAQYLTAGLQLANLSVIALTVIPLYERLKPILESAPETPESMAHPGELYGDLELSHVSFRYGEGQPLVLDDISLKIRQGEFVAIVGQSGSGKSTLLRLLLGFEKPETGSIAYDQKDLKELDLRAVRQQIGVVLQNARFLAGGNIYQNIVGISEHLTLDDAWNAAEMAGLAEDIRKMPMGIHTIVSEGSGTLSGGQKQRLLIAAAIVNKPRIIFFDEATSALDNRTQQIVSASLERLDATRVVVAHRLSTIINADRIIVMDKGKIVQVGTYANLIKEKGLFAELAKRQLA